MLILWKWLLSFTRREWRITDYPILIRRNGDMPEPSIGWMAQVLNWPGLAGLGPTRDKAYEQLAERLEERRKYRDRMPRPGSHVPIQFAPTDRVAADEALLDDFIERALGFGESDPVFISDLSSLYDFGDEKRSADLVQRIKELYGVDVADIADGNIADILERIKQRSNQARQP